MGRDRTSTIAVPSPASFNPRARVGRDDAGDDEHADGAVSIHAPAWGATWSYCLWDNGSKFQSTRPRGARRCVATNYVWDYRFQSTRPRGARHIAHATIFFDAKFQSTRPRGARPDIMAELLSNIKFQSTRPRGARHPDTPFLQSIGQFQSTRPRGARRWRARWCWTGRRFNPRARVGRDLG